MYVVDCRLFIIYEHYATDKTRWPIVRTPPLKILCIHLTSHENFSYLH